MAEAALTITKPARRPRDATKAASRTAILDAARRVAAREGARDLSLRGVAAEAGFAPAALYGYFRSKDELLLALAADDLSVLARAMREAAATAVDWPEPAPRPCRCFGIPRPWRRLRQR